MSIVSNDRLLKIPEVAALLNAAPSSVWKWTKDGTIRSVRLPSRPGAKKGGAIRIPSSEVFKILNSKEPKALQGF